MADTPTLMSIDGLRLLPANLKVRLAAVASVLVFVATLLVTLSTLSVAERGMERVIGDQQYTLLSSAASFMDDRIEARLRELEGLAAGLPRDALNDQIGRASCRERV